MKPRVANSAAPIAALAYEIELEVGDDGAVNVPSRILVLPDGEFTGVDGRPKGLTFEDENGEQQPVRCTAWRLDARIAAQIIAVFREHNLDLVIDYDHQTLRAEENGRPAPAAGWITALEYEAGRGLWAAVNWTGAGSESVASREYRYLSPVFPFDPDTGAPLWLHSVALTNTPNLNQLGEIAAMASRLLSLNSSQHHQSGDPSMDLKTLLVALNLPLETTEGTALTALSAQSGKIRSLETECSELRALAFDPAKHIPLEEHQKIVGELTALKSAQDKATHEQLLQAALSDGRILQPNAAYWSQQPLAALQSFLKDAKPLAALTALQTGGNAPTGGTGAPTLSADEMAVCKSMGIAPEDFVRQRGTV
ncbi:phage protease [Paraburkholderia fungorum]|uniref:phage protease n=1 Tax=Paraburkholderia fungorum TaxID=134537 RepID=UPI00402B50B0